MSLWRDMLDFVLPQKCWACDLPHSQVGPLCALCENELSTLAEGVACGRCGKPLVDAEGPCPYCGGAGLRPFEAVVRLGVYDGPLAAMIHTMKFAGRWRIASYLAKRLAAKPAARKILDDADVIVPVPLHPIRQIGRGYDQADLIARGLNRRKVRSVLARTRSTAAQSLQDSRRSRAMNLRDAFVLLEPKTVTGKRIVLVDDVTTTGATLRAAAKAFRRAKPMSLHALTLAVADPLRRRFTAIEPLSDRKKALVAATMESFPADP